MAASVDKLNSVYGAPGRIVFRDGFAGAIEAVLASRYGVAEVALFGANVLSYRPTGHAPVLFRPAKRDYAPGDSFHGGVPVCFPQFGRMAIPTMAQHGFARSRVWSVVGSQYSEEMSEITLALRSDDATRALWPHDFKLTLKVSVSMKLNFELTVKNTGEKPFAYSCGLHPYLRVRDRDAVTVNGLDSLEAVRTTDNARRIQSGAMAVTSSSEAFELPPSPRHEFAVIDGGLRRAIALASSGNDCAVVWNPGVEQPIADFEEGDWRKFVCVEPVSTWPGVGAPLAPGESRSLVVAIQSVADIAADMMAAN